MTVIGKPRVFKDENEFLEKVEGYLEYCEEKERFANIAGLCRYLDIGRTTFYDQKKYYSNTYEKVEAMLEDDTLNNKTCETAIKVLYLKNKFDYRDKIEAKNDNVNTNKNIDMGHLTTEQIKELLNNE